MKSSDVDAAIVSLLAADAELQALAPGGVYVGLAPDAVQQYVAIGLVAHDVERVLPDAVAWEAFTYDVRANDPGSSAVQALAAAARIRDVLEGAGLAVAGGAILLQRYVAYARVQEYDDATGRRWQTAGGRYSVQVCPTNNGGSI